LKTSTSRKVPLTWNQSGEDLLLGTIILYTSEEKCKKLSHPKSTSIYVFVKLLPNSRNSRAIANPPHFSWTGVKEEDLAGCQTAMSPHLSLINPAFPGFSIPASSCLSKLTFLNLSPSAPVKLRYISTPTRCIRRDNQIAIPKLRSRAAPILSVPALKDALTIMLVFGPELAHWG
jgi:hypothetical protein